MELFKFHFDKLEERSNHYSYPYFHKFVEEITPLSSIIIEIGIKEENKSTLIFNAIANKYNGNFITSDNNEEIVNTFINKVGVRTQVIKETPIMFIYNLVSYLRANDNFKNTKVHLHLNMYDTNLTEIENANIYLNAYYIAKSIFIPGSQILVNTNNNETLINILKKEIPQDWQIHINDDERYLLFKNTDDIPIKTN
jgi:hypothetical protein